jgi:tetratricopeptide (TPR) repeat protein
MGATLGPFRLTAELGAGGMGTVWRAEVVGQTPGLDAGSVVALKVVHEHVAGTPGFLERFLREGEVGRRVRHENIVSTLATGCDDGRHWIALEVVEGQTLRSLLDELGRVPEELCRHVGREVAKGLAALHEAGLVHRDVKPENVIVTKDHVVKLMDLGIARGAEDPRRVTQTGLFVGSVHYAAPEQFTDGGRSLDGRADLHALGVTLYELATGTNPFLAADLPQTLNRVLNDVPRRAGELNPQLSACFEETLRTLLEKDRERRFSSSAALAAVLDEGDASSWWKERAASIQAATRKPVRRIRIPRETALYGRDAEIVALRESFGRAKAGDGQVLLVEGEAGIGKSRLVDEFAGLLAAAGEDFDFLHGSYPPGGAATASGAFSTAYREHFGARGSDAALRAALPGTPLLVPAFAALLAGDAPPPGTEPLTKDSLQTVFVRATQSLAAVRPTVVLIDDLHFAPEEGRALFAALALAVPDHRIVLIGTARPGVDGRWLASFDRLQHAQRLALARLGPADLVRLLADALRSETLAEDLAGKIAAKSDGNPYFVFELLQGLREGKFLSRRPDGTWVTTQVIRDIEIPPSISELIQARISEVSDADRDLLEAASCVGFEFDPVLAGAVVGLGAIPALQRLGAIEKRLRVVRSAGRRFVFDHHQVQESLYAGVSEPLRERYHAAIAETLETAGRAAERDPAEISGPLCVELAEHFLQGACGGRALRYLDRALQHLTMSYLGESMIRLARRALDDPALAAGPRRCRILLRMGEHLGRAGRTSEERAAVDEAIALADAGRWDAFRAEARLRLGSHLRTQSREAEAVPVLETSADLARAAKDVMVEGSALGLLGLCLSAQGRAEDAEAIHVRQLALAREADDAGGEIVALANLGGVRWARGKYEDAVAVDEQALGLARGGRHRHNEADLLGNLGMTLQELGRNDEACDRLSESVALARELGYRRSEAVGVGNYGNALRARGYLARALELYERHVALSREVGYRRGEAVAAINQGSTNLQLGRIETAVSHLRYYLQLAEELSFRRGVSDTLQFLGEAAAEQGDWVAAERLHAEALDAARTTRRPGGEVFVLTSLGAVLDACGRLEEARAASSRAVEVARAEDASAAPLEALCRLAALGGDVAVASAALSAQGPRVEVRVRMEAHFLLFRATGDRAHLAEAKRLLDHLVENAPEDCRETMLSNVSLHRAIAAAALDGTGS